MSVDASTGTGAMSTMPSRCRPLRPPYVGVEVSEADILDDQLASDWDMYDVKPFLNKKKKVGLPALPSVDLPVYWDWPMTTSRVTAHRAPAAMLKLPAAIQSARNTKHDHYYGRNLSNIIPGILIYCVLMKILPGGDVKMTSKDC